MLLITVQICWMGGIFIVLLQSYDRNLVIIYCDIRVGSLRLMQTILKYMQTL